MKVTKLKHNPTNKKHRSNTEFYKTWGERPCDIAAREDVHLHTITMRVRNHGNPYQRVAQPGRWEIYYGITGARVSQITGLSETILWARIAHLEKTDDLTNTDYLLRPSRCKPSSQELKSWRRPQIAGWLMPEHINYSDWHLTGKYLGHRVCDLTKLLKVLGYEF